MIKNLYWIVLFLFSAQAYAADQINCDIIFNDEKIETVFFPKPVGNLVKVLNAISKTGASRNFGFGFILSNDIFKVTIMDFDKKVLEGNMSRASIMAKMQIEVSKSTSFTLNGNDQAFDDPLVQVKCKSNY